MEPRAIATHCSRNGDPSSKFDTEIVHNTRAQFREASAPVTVKYIAPTRTHAPRFSSRAIFPHGALGRDNRSQTKEPFKPSSSDSSTSFARASGASGEFSYCPIFLHCIFWPLCVAYTYVRRARARRSEIGRAGADREHGREKENEVFGAFSRSHRSKARSKDNIGSVQYVK